MYKHTTTLCEAVIVESSEKHLFDAATFSLGWAFPAGGWFPNQVWMSGTGHTF